MLLIGVYDQSTRNTAWKVTSHDGFVWIGVIGIDLLRGVGEYRPSSLGKWAKRQRPTPFVTLSVAMCSDAP